ncbi:hypothetical protein TheetDRAFT_2850 [Thermoanaerobacter ethanolicus JW 200]|nr:hypothetical protein TheetDRAFT_2850 [Thermoanaerobacter ethanolicus JW 200]
MTEIEEIKKFLNNAKELMKSGAFDFVPRKKNMDSIKEAGLTIKHVKEVIMDLTYKIIIEALIKIWEATGKVLYGNLGMILKEQTFT